MATRPVGSLVPVAPTEGGTGLTGLGMALQVLRTNAGVTAAEWATIAGTGDVVGPGAATDNAITRFDMATGKLLQNSTVLVDDTGNVTLPTGTALRTALLAGNTLLLQARDVDGAAYTTFGTLTANNTPTFDLSTDVTFGGLTFPRILSTTTAIDGKVIATTSLYTVPAGKTAVVTGAIIRLTTATMVTVTGAMGIGVAAGESDIFGSVSTTGLLAAGDAFSFVNAGFKFVTVAAAGVIKLGIDTGFTATTATLAADLIGYLL